MPPETSDHPTQLGNYDVILKIAEGGMGMVYKAKSRATGELVAIKVISPGTAKNPVTLQRFEREFAAAKILDHPNVVRAIEYCGIGPSPFLVMEFVDGESLGQMIERTGPLPEAEAVRLMSQVCDGLQRAHKQGLVHRDVKPDNILVTRDGVAKLTDMGLVKEVEGDLNLTKTGRGLGTPHYMAPEQFRNAKGVDVRGDIYSLGATLYAAVTGSIPFENANPLDCWMKKIRNEFAPPKERNPAVSDRVDWAIRRAMSAEPAQRPSSCREFLEDLTGQSRTVPTGATGGPAAADVWYMVYRDDAGQTHTVKGGTESIRKALKDGLLGDASAIMAGRTKTGQFRPLDSFPEFRDLLVTPAAMSIPGRAGSGTVPKRTGTVPAAAGRVAPADMVNLGEPLPPGPGTSGANRTGRAVQPAVPPGRTPTVGTPRPMVSPPTTGEARDPYAETAAYEPSGRGRTPTASPAVGRPPAPKARPPKKSFDWTPVLFVVIAFLSAAVGYLLMTR